MRTENTDDGRWLVQKSGDTAFVERQGSEIFWMFRFGWRHHSTVLEKEFQGQRVLLEVKNSQRGRDGTQMPADGRHHLPKEIIQFRHRGKGIQASPKGPVCFCQFGCA